jgi:isopentenyl-diphosphate delta-isomerase
MEARKKDHIELAFQAQTPEVQLDPRFIYEPLLSAHPASLTPFTFLGKTFRAPMWVSSMTGGTERAASINQNLARACKEFGFGMGLGSCRAILDDDHFFSDFDVRKIIGDELPLYANLGICQVEQLFASGKTDQLLRLVKRLRADGLIVHVNPLQEWFQPEGDRMRRPPLETLQRLLDLVPFPIIVKEVGQGMGPESLKALLSLPLAAIEFGAFGGTNFSEIERLRGGQRETWISPMRLIGADALAMLNDVNKIVSSKENIRCKQIIISGGIKNYLDGYYFTEKSQLPAVYGMASSFLKYAIEGYEPLRDYIAAQLEGLAMAQAFLRVK